MSNRIKLHYTVSYPRPSNGVLIGSAPGGGDIVGASITLNPLRMNEFQVQTNEDSGRMHGGVLYSNILDSRYFHSIYLQPKSLTPTNKNYLINYWLADFKYIEFLDAGAGLNNVRQVTTGGGKMPISRINENKYLNEVTLELTEVLPHGY